MSTDCVDVGTTANDGTGDTVRAGFQEVNKFLQQADTSSAAKIHVLEDTDGGTNKVIITISGTGLLAADRTLSLPTGGNLSLETLRTFAHTEAASGVPASGDFLEDSDNGTNKITITAPSSAAADRTLTLISGGDLDLETVRKFAHTAATSGAAAYQSFAEDTDNGAHVCKITGPTSAAADRNLTLPSGGDLDLETIRVFNHTAAASGTVSSLDVYEDTDSGTNYCRIAAPTALGGDRTLTLPDADVDISAMIAEDTDGHMWLPAMIGAGISGTWTAQSGANSNPVITRVASASAEIYHVPICLPGRTTASRGAKITSYKAVYSVDTAALDDVKFILLSSDVPADGSAPGSLTTVAGSADGNYDTDHNTAAKRGDHTGGPEYHTATVTVGSPAYVGDGEGYHVRVWVDGDAGAASVFRLYGLHVYYSQTLIDVA